MKKETAMPKSAVFTFMLIFTAAAAFCYAGNKILPKKDFRITTASGAYVNIRAEIADTQETRKKGLMERKNIPDGTGMLFVFKTDDVLEFWMKNTPSPLSIAYIDSSGKIKDILDMVPYSLAGVTSSGYVRYALEVPQGWFARNGIKTGDTINISEVLDR